MLILVEIISHVHWHISEPVPVIHRETGIISVLPSTPRVGAQQKAVKFPGEELAGKEKSHFLLSIYSLK